LVVVLFLDLGLDFRRDEDGLDDEEKEEEEDVDDNDAEEVDKARGRGDGGGEERYVFLPTIGFPISHSRCSPARFQQTSSTDFSFPGLCET
jgi:hypothetical protein